MIFSKIKKHFSIVLVRLFQKIELKKIREERNNTLSLVLDAFLDIKSNRISKNDYSIFQDCEHYRAQLLKNNSLISYAVFGINEQLTVSQICKKASSASIWWQFLFYLIIIRIILPTNNFTMFGYKNECWIVNLKATNVVCKQTYLNTRLFLCLRFNDCII